MVTRRIEIVHESLLAKWPRLVHWQTQDADGAQLRDELRQAAQLWQQHDRSKDFLWTGDAYRGFQLWRSRYGGNLTDIEQAFALAIIANAQRRRHLRLTATRSCCAGTKVWLQMPDSIAKAAGSHRWREMASGYGT